MKVAERVMMEVLPASKWGKALLKRGTKKITAKVAAESIEKGALGNSFSQTSEPADVRKALSRPGATR